MRMHYLQSSYTPLPFMSKRFVRNWTLERPRHIHLLERGRQDYPKMKKDEDYDDTYDEEEEKKEVVDEDS